MSKTIVFQIHRKHDSESRHSACRRAFAYDETVFQSFENAAVEILFHRTVYVVYSLVLVAVFEVRFGENEFERTVSVADEVFEFLPVAALGRKLIASDDRPFLMIAIIGYEYVATSYSFHLNLPFLRILPPSFLDAWASLKAIAVGEMPYASSISSLSLSIVI